MFRQCRLPQPSPNPPSEWRIISFFIEVIPHFHVLPLQVRPSLLFSFSAFLLPFVLPPAWRGWLSLIQVRRCSGFAHSWVTLAQQGRQPVSLVLLPYLAPKTAHRPSRGRIHFFSPERVYLPPLGGGAGYLLSWFAGFALLVQTDSHCQQGWSGASLVSFPYPAPKSLTGPHRGEFGFSHQNELTPPPKGGGAGYRLSWVGPARSQLAHTGPNRACLGLRWCRFPTWLSKPHTAAHGGEFGFHRLFLVRFFCGSPASWRSRW